MPKEPMISTVTLTRGFGGGWKIQYSCPACKATLTSKRADIGRSDGCPDCGVSFRLDSKIESEIRAKELAEKQLEDRREQESRALRQQFLAQQTAEAEARITQDAAAEDRAGYAYPNLKGYQRQLESIGFLGALLQMICSIIASLILLGNSSDSATVFIAIMILLVGGIIALSWYYSWMVLADLIRLVVTVALDIRKMRDHMAAGRDSES